MNRGESKASAKRISCTQGEEREKTIVQAVLPN